MNSLQVILSIDNLFQTKKTSETVESGDDADEDQEDKDDDEEEVSDRTLFLFLTALAIGSVFNKCNKMSKTCTQTRNFDTKLGEWTSANSQRCCYPFFFM